MYTQATKEKEAKKNTSVFVKEYMTDNPQERYPFAIFNKGSYQVAFTQAVLEARIANIASANEDDGTCQPNFKTV